MDILFVLIITVYDLQPNDSVSGLSVESSDKNQVSIDPPSGQVLCWNNKRYNKSMISLTGSILLSVIFVAGACTMIYFRHVMTPSLNTVDDQYNMVILQYVMIFWLSVLLPMLYFILNPNHFFNVLQELRG